MSASPKLNSRGNAVTRQDGQYKDCSKCKRHLRLIKFDHVNRVSSAGLSYQRIQPKCRECLSAEAKVQFRNWKRIRTPEELRVQSERKKKWANHVKGMTKRVPVRKRCSKCKLVKLASEFYKNYRMSSGLGSSCRKCLNIVNRISGRKKALKDKYGLTIEQFDSMLQSQGGVCSICKIKPAICVDHNHETGENRDLLCNGCNLLVGNAYERIQTLRNAADYLERHGKTS